MSESRPFAGIEVVEFGQFIAVPFCAQLLAEGGAHVIKVESLDGDPVRHLAPIAPGETRHFISRNRGKHSLPLDLRHRDARRIIDALLARADVVLFNFRPGLAEKLGLDYASLAPRFPRLVVGSVTAFGTRGPDAGLAGMDLVLQARSGLMASNGRVQDDVPGPGESPIADYVCALSLAFGIASALLRRTATGRGGQVEAALFMAALLAQNNAMVRVASEDIPRHAAALAQLAELRAAGAPYAAQAAVVPHTRTPAMVAIYYRTYRTKDAPVGIACVSPGIQRTLMRAVGLEDAAHTRRMDRDEQARHYEALRGRMEAVMASRTAAEWKAIFDRVGVPNAQVRFHVEMFEDPQALANGFFHDLPHPAAGTVRVLAPPIRLDGDGFQPGAPTPAFASETRAILGSLGFSEREAEDLVKAGASRDMGPPGGAAHAPDAPRPG
jgi:crotonobetainyl-CoA:carnitine CoA-transferase CaiB-like acyl-CoA transferase